MWFNLLRRDENSGEYEDEAQVLARDYAHPRDYASSKDYARPKDYASPRNYTADRRKPSSSIWKTTCNWEVEGCDVTEILENVAIFQTVDCR